MKQKFLWLQANERLRLVSIAIYSGERFRGFGSLKGGFGCREVIELFGDVWNGIALRIVLESNYESFSLIVIGICAEVSGVQDEVECSCTEN